MWLKVIAVGLVLYMIYRWSGGMLAKGGSNPGREHSSEEEDGDTMVECGKCSTYVLKEEAVEYKGIYYCSKECLPDHGGA